MSWGTYESRMDVIGPTRRNAALKREWEYLANKLPNSLSYHKVTIDDVEQDVAIINTDNLNEKFIYSMPAQDLPHGGLVYYMDCYWLITERDFANEVYTRCRLLQCNYLLKWVDTQGEIYEQWCAIEDGTKYMTGIYEDRDFITTRSDSRLAITLAKNDATTKLRRGTRFIIDDPDSELCLTYELTKPFKLHNVYNSEGVFKFVCQEVNTTEDDNPELGIADYYKYYSREVEDVVTSDVTINPDENVTDDGRKVWL